MIVKLLTEHNLEFLSLKGDCRGLSNLHLTKFQIVGNLMLRLNDQVCVVVLQEAQMETMTVSMLLCGRRRDIRDR